MPRRLPVIDSSAVPFECTRCKTVVLIPPLAWLLGEHLLASERGLRCPVCGDKFSPEET